LKKIAILGTGGNCVDILETLRALQAYECVGFLDDDPARHHTTILGVPVLGPLDKASSLGDVRFVNGIGSTRTYLR
jgi:acetyltransferase EpsM